ncbi:MAG: formylglycine-generating enzyme family protein [Bacteroidetes bacterium]|jgi:formylglycine-generating enzyme required for sulfatase activity|nr:formylglycine-generating enzyme family protein [Bacteroidota bacterium]
MNRLFSYIFSIILCISILSSQQAQVTNVVAAQRTDGSKLVDIYYNITQDDLFNYYSINVEISFDGGSIYTPTNYLTGDYGIGITSGNDKHIVWLLGSEYPDVFFDNIKIKVIATGYIEENLPFEFISIPSGDFTYGLDSEIMTIEYDFEIMKYEITNAQYAEFLIEGFENGEIWLMEDTVEGFYTGDEHYSAGNYILYSLGDPETFDGISYGRISWNGTTFTVTEGFGNHPCVHVSWFGAWKFAEHYGLRLPDDFEWEKSARGISGSIFSWGNELEGDRGNYLNSGDPWDNGTTPIGFYNGDNFEGFQTVDSPSPYGVYDMTGNVNEWIISWFTEDSNHRVFRGGGWQDGQVEVYHRNLGEQNHYYWTPHATPNNRGFRLVNVIQNID